MKNEYFLFQFWHKSENALPKMTHFNPFQTEWIKLNDFLNHTEFISGVLFEVNAENSK